MTLPIVPHMLGLTSVAAYATTFVDTNVITVPVRAYNLLSGNCLHQIYLYDAAHGWILAPNLVVEQTWDHDLLTLHLAHRATGRLVLISPISKDVPTKSLPGDFALQGGEDVKESIPSPYPGF